MTNNERDILVAERIMGWKWEMKETSTDWWTRRLLPPNDIGQYTPIWDGRKCDYVDTTTVGYFNPSIYPSAALQVKDRMEQFHGFECELAYNLVNYKVPWYAVFQKGGTRIHQGGETLQEAIVNAVLRDSIKEILEQA